jgi:lysophospholipase L1-like esterase
MLNCFRSVMGWGLIAVSCAMALGQEAQKPAEADKWEAAIKTFEDQARKTPVAEGANLFVGSSSIRLWKLESSFPNHACVNHGFGGSQLGDSAKYAERIVIPHKPRVVVVYAGDNDIAAGKTPEAVFADYRSLRDKLHAALPETKLVFVSIKPSPSRWKLREKGLEANRLIREEIARGKNQVFVDIWTPMLGDDGMPRPELFVKDNLHMSDAGYATWNKLVEPHLVR